MGLLREAGALGFTDGLRAVADARVMPRAPSYAGGLGALILQHPEDPSLAHGGAMTESELATRLGVHGIPDAAEVMMVERDLRPVELTGGRYHASHLSTRAGLDAVRAAKRRGLPVTCDRSEEHTSELQS